MWDFQKIVVLLILLLLPVCKTQSSLEPNQSESGTGTGSKELETAVVFEYETKYSAGDIHIPVGLICSDYNNFELPPGPRDEGGSVSVLFGVKIYSLPDFQEDQQELSIEWVMIVTWQDSRFDEYAENGVKGSVADEDGNPPNILLDPRLLDRIWHPHITLASLKSNAQVSLMGADGSGYLQITPQENSTVVYRVRSTLQTTCETDYTFYPFDLILCPITLKNPLYFDNQVVISEFELLSRDLQVAGFTVILSAWQQGPIVFQDQNYSRLGFKILLKRNPTSSVIQFYIPSAVFIIICFGSFTLTETSDRITCTSVSLLSLFVLLGSIGSTPQGPYVTYLHKWVLMCILIVFLPLVEIFLVLKLKIYEQRRVKRIEKEGGKADAKREEGENVDFDVEAPPGSTNTNTTPKPKEGEKGQRKSKLLRIIWLLEKATPYLVISTFFIYNIYYWSVLITATQQEIKEYIIATST